MLGTSSWYIPESVISKSRINLKGVFFCNNNYLDVHFPAYYTAARLTSK